MKSWDSCCQPAMKPTYSRKRCGDRKITLSGGHTEYPKRSAMVGYFRNILSVFVRTLVSACAKQQMMCTQKRPQHIPFGKKIIRSLATKEAIYKESQSPTVSHFVHAPFLLLHTPRSSPFPPASVSFNPAENTPHRGRISLSLYHTTAPWAFCAVSLKLSAGIRTELPACLN